MSIGAAARASGLSQQTIRRYECLGLLPAPVRTDSGYRRYRAEDIEWLRCLRQARDLEFPLRRLKRLRHHVERDAGRVALSREVREHLDDVRRRLLELRRVEAGLTVILGEPGERTGPLGALLGRAAHPPPSHRPVEADGGRSVAVIGA